MRAWRPAVLLLAWLTAPALVNPLWAQNEAQIFLRLAQRPEGLTAAFNGKAPVPLRELPGGALVNGLRLAPDTDPTALNISGVEREVVVEVEGFDGWAARLPAGNTLHCRIDAGTRMLDLQTPEANPGEVGLTFADGARAQMRGASSARFDLFQDGSYYLAGRGRVSAVDADGLARELSPFLPPMLGGPLQKTAAEGKQPARFQRLTPLVEIAVGGKPGGALELFIGKQRFKLDPLANRAIELPNGTLIELTQDANTSSVNWRVRKGVCRVWLAGFDCWSTLLTSEQSAGSVWNLEKGAVDLSPGGATNGFPTTREVLVRIANRFSASVPAGATFQYINVQNCTTYVAASDRPVEIFNPDSRQITRIGSDATTTFRSGVPATSLTVPNNIIAMNWEEGADLRVSGTAGDFKVAPKTRQLLRGENASQLDVNYADTGLIEVKAVSSAYQIEVRPLKDWQVRVGEGDGMGFYFDAKTGVFFGTANPANTAPVTFQTPEGFTPQVNPGGMITVMTSQAGALPSRLMGSVVFYEQGGVGGGVAFGSSLQPTVLPMGAASLNTFGSPNNLIDPARVPQPGASVVGGK